jgi:hypothetical protein
MSYKAIAKEIPCSKSTVNYFLTEGAKEKVVARNRRHRRNVSRRVKEEHGGACVACGYDKCLQALEFDHIDPKDKKSAISDIRDNIIPALAEAAKCLLLCCRCHRERHAGLLDIGAYLEPSL